MSDYIFEVGIDRHAEPRPDGTYPMFFSICKPNVPAWATQFKSGETFKWHFFDYTEAPSRSSEGHLNLVGFTMSMVYANARNTLFSISPQIPLCYGQNYHPDLAGIKWSSELGSEVFGRSGQTWNIMGGWGLPDDQRSSASFTFSTVEFPTKVILQCGVIAIIHTDSGRQELRHFSHDPEIIVGPGT